MFIGRAAPALLFRGPGRGLLQISRLFALTLAWTGARISEVLAVKPRSFQVGTSVLALLSLKRRSVVWREVPIPPWLMARLDAHFDIAGAQLDPARAALRLWPQHRVTGWHIIKHAMKISQFIGRGMPARAATFVWRWRVAIGRSIEFGATLAWSRKDQHDGNLHGGMRARGNRLRGAVLEFAASAGVTSDGNFPCTAENVTR